MKTLSAKPQFSKILKVINEGLLNNGLRIMTVADMVEGIREQTGTIPLIDRGKGVVITT